MGSAVPQPRCCGQRVIERGFGEGTWEAQALPGMEQVALLLETKVLFLLWGCLGEGGNHSFQSGIVQPPWQGCSAWAVLISGLLLPDGNSHVTCSHENQNETPAGGKGWGELPGSPWLRTTGLTGISNGVYRTFMFSYATPSVHRR